MADERHGKALVIERPGRDQESDRASTFRARCNHQQLAPVGDPHSGEDSGVRSTHERTTSHRQSQRYDARGGSKVKPNGPSGRAPPTSP